MDKFLAIVVLIIVVLIAIPHLRAGEWLAPTAVDPDSWMVNAPSAWSDNQLAQAAAVPSQGYGWFHFDFWNYIGTPNEAAGTVGRPVRKGDFAIRL